MSFFVCQSGKSFFNDFLVCFALYFAPVKLACALVPCTDVNPKYYFLLAKLRFFVGLSVRFLFGFPAYVSYFLAFCLC